MKAIFKMAVLLVCTFVFFSGLAFSQQDYPTKPVTLIHGYGAGGNTDLSVRILGEFLSKTFNQPFVTVAKPGGGQTLAASFLARSAPDGYTVGTFYQVVFTVAPFLQEVPYKLEDFKPVIGWQTSPLLLLCRPDAPYKNLKELIAYAKTHSLKIGHNGKGTATYLVPKVFTRQVGINLVDVPFKGDADQLTAVMGGHIDLGSLSATGAAQLTEAGKVRALVTYSKKRLKYQPQIPTFEDEGFSNPVSVAVGMTFVPKETPDAIVRKLHDAIKNAINDPKAKDEFAKIKQDLNYFDTKEMLEIIEKEKQVYYPILKESGLTK